MRHILLLIAFALLTPGASATHDGPQEEVCVPEGPVTVTCVSEHEGSCDASRWHDTVSYTSVRLFGFAHVTAQNWCENDRVYILVQAPSVFVSYTDASDGSCTIFGGHPSIEETWIRQPCPVDQRAPNPGWGTLLP